MKTIQKVAIAAALSTVFAGSVLASPGHEHGDGEKRGCARGQMHKMKGAHMEQRLAAIKQELKLTAKQEPAWQAFEKTVRDQKAAHQASHGTHGEGDRLEARIGHMEQRLAGMKAVAKARQALYDTLTPEQKEIADRLFQHGPHA